MNILKRLFGKKEVTKTDDDCLFIGSTVTVPKTCDIPFSSYKAYNEVLISRIESANINKDGCINYEQDNEDYKEQ